MDTAVPQVETQCKDLAKYKHESHEPDMNRPSRFVFKGKSQEIFNVNTPGGNRV